MDNRICPVCDEVITPARRLGPHMSAHKRVAAKRYVYTRDDKHPQEWITCRQCGERALVRAHGKGFCSTRCAQMGENNSVWKGDQAKRNSGRLRAHRLYPELGDCEVCGEKAAHRHHVNRNTFDNSPENIQFLCVRCHGAAHRRLERNSCEVCGEPTSQPRGKFCGQKCMGRYFSATR